MISLACERCGAVLRVADAMAGKKGKCQKCGAVLVVPSAPDPVPAPASAPPAEAASTASPGGPVAQIISSLPSAGWAAAKVFAILKWVALGLAGVVLLMLLAEPESAPRQAVLAGVACFFGIVGRLMQAEEQNRKK